MIGPRFTDFFGEFVYKTTAIKTIFRISTFFKIVTNHQALCSLSFCLSLFLIFVFFRVFDKLLFTDAPLSVAVIGKNKKKCKKKLNKS